MICVLQRSLLLAMILICLGVGLRSLPFVSLLFIGTAIIGCGIALGNVLLPGLIKRDFSQHVAKMTGAYSLTMGGAAALGSAMVVPLALAGLGWRGALLMLMAFPLLALFIWLPQARRQVTAPLTGSGAIHNRGIWRSALAWQVTLFLGINSGAGDPVNTASVERSARHCGAGRPDVRSQRARFMVFTRSGGAVDAYLWLRFRRDHDSGIDLYRAARQLGASGRRAVGNGAGGGLSAGRLRTAGDGKNS